MARVVLCVHPSGPPSHASTSQRTIPPMARVIFAIVAYKTGATGYPVRQTQRSSDP